MVMVTEVATATTGTIMVRKSTSLNGDTATITTQTTAVADRAGIVTTLVIAILVITTRVIITLAITEMAAVVAVATIETASTGGSFRPSLAYRAVVIH